MDPTLTALALHTSATRNALILSKCLMNNGATSIAAVFKVKNGLPANLGLASTTKLAGTLHTVAVSEKTAPSYLFIDRGEP